MSGPERFKPTGTIALLVVYMIILLALWANVFFTLISRGVTL